MKTVNRRLSTAARLVTAGAGLLAFYAAAGLDAQQAAPRYIFDPTWPKPLPGNWKMGGSPAWPSTSGRTPCGSTIHAPERW